MARLEGVPAAVTSAPNARGEEPDIGSTFAPLRAARRLSRAVDEIAFDVKTEVVYNPVEYAWDLHAAYLRRFGAGDRRRALWLGMNPGPWGMVQTGVPFGDVTVVTEWMGLEGKVGRPPVLHPKRPVEGLGCERNERSGTRLWTFARDAWGGLEAFFEDHLVVNYCPLAFFDEEGTNLTPNRLLKAQRETLFVPCDAHLRVLVAHYRPDVVVGVGAFATRRAEAALAEDAWAEDPWETEAPSAVDVGAGDGTGPEVVRILHPSPANPKANQGWAEQVEPVLEQHGVGP